MHTHTHTHTLTLTHTHTAPIYTFCLVATLWHLLCNTLHTQSTGRYAQHSISCEWPFCPSLPAAQMLPILHRIEARLIRCQGRSGFVNWLDKTDCTALALFPSPVEGGGGAIPHRLMTGQEFRGTKYLPASRKTPSEMMTRLLKLEFYPHYL